MILDDLLGTSGREALLSGDERTLLTATRGAAVLGATLVVPGAVILVLVPLLTGSLSVDAGAGGAGLVVGGGLWVLTQGLVARWIQGRDSGTLLLAAGCVGPAAVAGFVGVGVTAGVTWSQVLAFGALLTTLVQAVLVWRMGPEWHGIADPGGRPGAAELLYSVAQVAVALGLLVGVSSAWGLVHYTAHLDEDWNLLGAWMAGGLVLVAVLWTLPHAVLLLWTGGGWGTRRGIVVVLGAVPVVAVALFAATVVVPWWVLGFGLVAVIAVLEVVLGAKLWSERASVSR
ncbi:hypothetical protein [Nocardioides jishulii]|uniref:Uncharacterized protein n=1 Tax=Nocardioides jishulii TaxID=2575440 RepID=A0A4U2YHH6_9ACTN|nr:hypothetical protein [Nocardioides jishulii]QCX26720.1 hypothetical protein FCL41_03550 [Nocardioides jishulii]TKI60310.1 hypothetical protein FC770_16000 [Nocardioides jishulii]